MTDIKGPAVDPDAFKVEGHCCAIRLPVTSTLTEAGIDFRLTPEARAQLVKDGVLPADKPTAEIAATTSPGTPPPTP